MANKILFFKKYIEIRVDRGDADSVSKCLQIPYVYSTSSQTYFRASYRFIDYILKTFRNIDENNISTASEALQKIYYKEKQRCSVLDQLRLGDPIDKSSWLWTHQQIGREIANYNDRFGFFYDTRTGKTPMSLQIIVDDIQKNPTNKWLIVCPLILIENAWLADCETFFPNEKMIVLHHSLKTKRIAKFKQPGNIYIINTESVASYLPYIKNMGFEGIIFDESSSLKNPSSKTTKAVLELSQLVNRWYPMSGSPAPNGEYEYYAQLKSLDHYGIHQSFSAFGRYFFNDLSNNRMYHKYVLRADKREEFLELIRFRSMYVDKQDVLTLPGREFNVVPLQMPVYLQDHYHLMRTKLYTELVVEGSEENIEVLAPSTAVKLSKLNQITSGFVIDTDDQKTYQLSEYRIRALKQVLNSIGDKQVLIWAYYRHEFKMLKELLGDNCELVYGGVSIKDKNKAIQDWKQGKFQYLVANPASADKGLTLVNAHHAIYFSMGYSYELWKQSVDRIYGDVIKQANKCFYHILLAEGTIDEVIYKAVHKKEDLSYGILDHLKGGM